MRTPPLRSAEPNPSTESQAQCFLSPKELAERWSCSRTSAHRIAEREGISRYLFGQGRNGMVRYSLADVERYEAARKFPPQANANVT